MKYGSLVFIYLVFVAASFSQNISTLENPQINNNWIYDGQNLLTNSKSIDRLNEILSELERDTDIEIMIAILPSIGEENPKQYAVELFNHWRIGKKGKDNGILILHVLDQRRIELEIGYGLEGILTDVLSKRILESKVIPYFKVGAYSVGHESLIITLDRLMREPSKSAIDIQSIKTNLPEPDAALVDEISDPNLEIKNKRTDWTMLSLVLGSAGLLILILFPLALFRYAGKIKTKYYQDYERQEAFDLWSLFAFGLFSLLLIAALTLMYQSIIGNQYILFVLILTSISFLLISFFAYKKLSALWENYLTKVKLKCNHCGSDMDRLNHKENYYTNLSDIEKKEKEIRTYQFDLFECSKCKKIHKIRLPGSDFSLYSICKVCHCRSLLEVKQVEKFPTLTESGIAEINTDCKNCGFHENATVILPITRDMSSSADTNGSSDSSSFSSSSSDSDSSSGGGSSGGGGAGSSY